MCMVTSHALLHMTGVLLTCNTRSTRLTLPRRAAHLASRWAVPWHAARPRRRVFTLQALPGAHKASREGVTAPRQQLT